jgi:hypothetical protein
VFPSGFNVRLRPRHGAILPKAYERQYRKSATIFQETVLVA